MYQRIFDITPYLDDSVFLFGARQTGKSTFLLDTFRDVPSFDLLDYELRSRFSKNPGLLGEILQDSPDGSLVIIDEIQKVPELLDEVHRLMVRKNMRFILCGSSARKLKKSSSNTLGGRAVPLPFYPLVSAEVPDFNLVRAVTNGMIPRHYMVENAANRLKGYVEVYIKEEVVEEALVRDLDAFSRFVEVAAIMDGEILNYENIASDCGVSANTVKQYFQILYDTLIGYEIPAYTKAMKRRLMQSPRFYYFDIGIVNYLTGRTSLKPGTAEFGHAFEHLVIQEIIAWLGYFGRKEKLSYWRTYTGIEVDAVIGDARIAIEIKSANEVKPKHRKGLQEFAKDYPGARLILVSLDRLSRRSGDVECLYVMDFLRMMWSGGLAAGL